MVKLSADKRKTIERMIDGRDIHDVVRETKVASIPSGEDLEVPKQSRRNYTLDEIEGIRDLVSRRLSYIEISRRLSIPYNVVRRYAQQTIHQKKEVDEESEDRPTSLQRFASDTFAQEGIGERRSERQGHISFVANESQVRELESKHKELKRLLGHWKRGEYQEIITRANVRVVRPNEKLYVARMAVLRVATALNHTIEIYIRNFGDSYAPLATYLNDAGKVLETLADNFQDIEPEKD